MSEKAKIIYCGSPELAIPPLSAILNSGEYEVLAVITQNDKPAGRGNKLTPPPVKVFAEQNNLRVFQPTTLKRISLSEGKLTTSSTNSTQLELLDYLNSKSPIDIFIVVAYGKIIPQGLIDFPRCGILNIHMSLLPRHRGAAPIQRAILEQDIKSGTTLMQIDAGLDTGPIYSMKEYLFKEEETSGSLAEELAKVGAELLLHDLPLILSNQLQAKPQTEAGASYAEKVSKEDFAINWGETAAITLAKIKAANPSPGAKCKLNSEDIKIFKATKHLGYDYFGNKPGEVVESNKAELIVCCGNKEYLSILELQFPGKKRMNIADALRGKAINIGDLFS
ncbi:MAG: methionyl-tRNA formyltransferase [Proteobacteria bacterium]|nr:methionyl-tRNA formyltransferase [Pseudomonadota bacterium]